MYENARCEVVTSNDVGSLIELYSAVVEFVYSGYSGLGVCPVAFVAADTLSVAEVPHRCKVSATKDGSGLIFCSQCAIARCIADLCAYRTGRHECDCRYDLPDDSHMSNAKLWLRYNTLSQM